jgi:hypothetical protein
MIDKPQALDAVSCFRKQLDCPILVISYSGYTEKGGQTLGFGLILVGNAMLVHQ